MNEKIMTLSSEDLTFLTEQFGRVHLRIDDGVKSTNVEFQKVHEKIEKYHLQGEKQLDTLSADLRCHKLEGHGETTEQEDTKFRRLLRRMWWTRIKWIGAVVAALTGIAGLWKIFTEA
jgi:hypothetical protein